MGLNLGLVLTINAIEVVAYTVRLLSESENVIIYWCLTQTKAPALSLKNKSQAWTKKDSEEGAIVRYLITFNGVAFEWDKIVYKMTITFLDVFWISQPKRMYYLGSRLVLQKRSCNPSQTCNLSAIKLSTNRLSHALSSSPMWVNLLHSFNMVKRFKHLL